MLHLFTHKIIDSKINYNNQSCTKPINLFMNEDIFAKSRNGHLLKDTFDRKAKTLDIRSNALYPANVLSNLAHNSFVFDGIECGSIEGVLQSLKTSDLEKQHKICKLYGGSAKKASKENQDWIKTQKLYWNGNCFERISKGYNDFLYNLFYACYTQNNIYKTALDSTKGITLTHLSGKHNQKETVLTSEEYVNILTKIRDNNK